MQISLPRVTDLGYFVLFPGGGMDTHAHDANELIMVARGTLHSERQGQAVTSEEGTVLLHPPGQEHNRHNRQDDSIYLYYLWWTGPQPDFVASLPPSVSDSRGRIRNLLEWMVESRRKKGDPELLGALTVAILHEYNRLAQQPDTDLVERFHAFVHEHLGEKLMLADVAAALSVSPSHLSHAYKDMTGESPMRALRRLRLIQARHLITHTNGTLEQIAQQTGFADAYHLSHRFRDHFGYPPGSLRRKD
jgi:AraC-like DNA-binding protein